MINPKKVKYTIFLLKYFLISEYHTNLHVMLHQYAISFDGFYMLHTFPYSFPVHSGHSIVEYHDISFLFSIFLFLVCSLIHCGSVSSGVNLSIYHISMVILL